MTTGYMLGRRPVHCRIRQVVNDHGDLQIRSTGQQIIHDGGSAGTTEAGQNGDRQWNHDLQSIINLGEQDDQDQESNRALKWQPAAALTIPFVL